jgi:hypothetical protein
MEKLSDKEVGIRIREGLHPRQCFPQIYDYGERLRVRIPAEPEDIRMEGILAEEFRDPRALESLIERLRRASTPSSPRSS